MREAGIWSSPYCFAIKEGDHEAKSDLTYFGARYYSPEIGRWTQRDPVGPDGGLNVYMLTGNEPVNRTDPWGLFWDVLWHELFGGSYWTDWMYADKEPATVLILYRYAKGYKLGRDFVRVGSGLIRRPPGLGFLIRRLVKAQATCSVCTCVRFEYRGLVKNKYRWHKESDDWVLVAQRKKVAWIRCPDEEHVRWSGADPTLGEGRCRGECWTWGLAVNQVLGYQVPTSIDKFDGPWPAL